MFGIIALFGIAMSLCGMVRLLGVIKGRRGLIFAAAMAAALCAAYMGAGPAALACGAAVGLCAFAACGLFDFLL